MYSGQGRQELSPHFVKTRTFKQDMLCCFIRMVTVPTKWWVSWVYPGSRFILFKCEFKAQWPVLN